MKEEKSPVIEKWMVDMGLHNNDIVIFAYIYANPKCTLDDIADFIDVRKDSAKRNIDRLVEENIVSISNDGLIYAEIYPLNEVKKKEPVDYYKQAKEFVTEERVNDIVIELAVKMFENDLRKRG